jgi:hypothetical protein|tara:strand:- start:71 stop:466 length:396 start_codon:yes stop_codon:yes gene_type:complete
MILGFPLIPGLQLFGRSRRLEELSGAFRASGVHPDLIPDAVLLTIIKLLKSTYGKDISSGMSDTCDFFAYLLLGQEALKYNLQDSKVYAFEKRLESALENSSCLDYKLLALSYHSGLINPAVKKEFKISNE